MMNRLLIALTAVLTLSGCAHWDNLSKQEKAAYIVSGSILVGALIIRNGQGDTYTINNCVSTKSLKTGCLSPPILVPPNK